MDELTKILKEARATGALKPHCATITMHEDAFMQDRARQILERAEKQLAGEMEFDFRWWLFAQLSEREKIQAAVADAVKADLILISMAAAKKLPREVAAWVEESLKLRPKSGGTVILVDGTGSEAGAEDLRHYLRNLSVQAGMAFWHLRLAETSGTLPESVETFTQRARQVTPVLEEILERFPTH